MSKRYRTPKRLVIDRKRWKRGNGMTSALLTDSGQMCCLGFYARACGFSRKEIHGRGELTGLVRDNDGDKRGISDRLLDAEDAFISANDDSVVRGLEREKKLVGLFADVGVKLSFRG